MKKKNRLKKSTGDRTLYAVVCQIMYELKNFKFKILIIFFIALKFFFRFFFFVFLFSAFMVILRGGFFTSLLLWKLIYEYFLTIFSPYSHVICDQVCKIIPFIICMCFHMSKCDFTLTFFE